MTQKETVSLRSTGRAVCLPGPLQLCRKERSRRPQGTDTELQPPFLGEVCFLVPQIEHLSQGRP